MTDDRSAQARQFSSQFSAALLIRKKPMAFNITIIVSIA